MAAIKLSIDFKNEFLAIKQELEDKLYDEFSGDTAEVTLKIIKFEEQVKNRLIEVAADPLNKSVKHIDVLRKTRVDTNLGQYQIRATISPHNARFNRLVSTIRYISIFSSLTKKHNDEKLKGSSEDADEFFDK